ncbi:hypothetical protein [Massilia sp. YIM B02443]|uniref:hypothetical protein n=1 Tax=Massilia sp. YIM B02443 TaxID=3050127 RepID=UPI0025B6ECB4|nr:hypothetical protein [Massilia sp. YIM B02443]MDN4038329.1 hypothetical protein [Massilia sp. YIM B02443]
MMDEAQAATWNKQREAGLAKWIIRRGILGFGLPMCFGLGLPWWLNDPDNIVRILTIHLPLCLILGGAVFGGWTWFISESQYRRYVALHGAPSVPNL